MTRLRPDGTFDTSFGDGGLSRIGPVSGALGRGIALQPDGHILVTGALGPSLVVARLDDEGNPDPTFASTTGPFGPGVLVETGLPQGSVGRDIALRPDGRAVVSGDLLVNDCSAGLACFSRRTAIAAQYLPNGVRDTAFGSGGLTPVAGVPAEGRGVALDAVGNVLVVVASTARTPNLLLTRLQPGGAPDPLFGTNGTARTPIGQAAAGNAVAVAPDGKVLVTGASSDTRGARVLTARFESGPSSLQCAPSPLDFGAVLLGTAPTTGTVTCTNTGPTGLQITDITRVGAHPSDFGIPSDGCSPVPLGAGQSCTLTVAFSPGAEGARTAALSITHDGKGGPIAVGLAGRGIARDTTLSITSPTFPEQLGLTTSPARSATVTNIGSVPITLNAIGTEGGTPGEFRVPAPTCVGVTLAPGKQCKVPVTFTPRTSGERASTIRVDASSAGGPLVQHRRPLSGTGATPTLKINPGVGHPGATAAVVGTRFPPGRAVTLRWVDPVTLRPVGFPEPAFTITTKPDGRLTAETLVFPRTRIGGRTLLATVSAFGADAPYVVFLGSSQPPGLLFRS